MIFSRMREHFDRPEPALPPQLLLLKCAGAAGTSGGRLCHGIFCLLLFGLEKMNLDNVLRGFNAEEVEDLVAPGATQLGQKRLVFVVGFGGKDLVS